jgi:hypothetical protein
MTDPLEEVLPPTAIEQVISIFEQLKDRDHGEIVQARKAVHEHIYGLISMNRLVVAGLAHLKPYPKASKKVKIRSHPESHIVELNDGTRWKIFPGDLDVTLNWKPETNLAVEPIDDEVSSHALVNAADKSSVRVIPATEDWPVREVKQALKGS